MSRLDGAGASYPQEQGCVQTNAIVLAQYPITKVFLCMKGIMTLSICSKSTTKHSIEARLCCCCG
jgi:hypothetical protein